LVLPKRNQTLVRQFIKEEYNYESYKSVSQRAMRAKGRAMRAMQAMRATVKMLRIFICNIYKKHLTENTALFQGQIHIQRKTRHQSNRFKLMKS